MDDMLSDVVSTADLKKFENIYHEQLYANNVTPKAQFEYAWCLVRSKYPADIKKGIVLLTELFNNHEGGKRDYLYYLAVGYARLKEYSNALKYIRMFLNVEPGNQQVISLQNTIQKKLDKEALVGMAITGGAVLAVGAVVGLALSVASKIHK